MALGLKILSLVAVLGGAGIGIPLYLKNQSKGQDLAAQKPSSSSPYTSDISAQVTNPFDKFSCQASSPTQAWEGFLQNHQKTSSSYSHVSCKNTFKGISNPLLKNNWEGLFPKVALEEVFSPKEGIEFEMTIEEKSEERNLESAFLLLFKNLETQSFIQSKHKDLKEEESRREFIFEMEKNKHTLKEIYLFVPAK